METLKQYLRRKNQELGLLNACLNSPLSLQRSISPVDVIRKKFRLASALKAEYAFEDWALTETAWAHSGRMRAGPFEFSYDYQRADLEVRGPSFYAFADPTLHDTVYTSSGMSAISALLFASKAIAPSADILTLPGSYGETLEFIDSYAHHLRASQLNDPAKDLTRSTAPSRILLLDCSAVHIHFEQTLRLTPTLDLVIFDTTSFSSGSKRIGRVLRWACRCEFPIVLVRSHTKLDSWAWNTAARLGCFH